MVIMWKVTQLSLLSKISLFVLLLFVTGCALVGGGGGSQRATNINPLLNSFGGEDTTTGTPKAPSIPGPQRGVVVAFKENKPTVPIKKDFVVGVVVANYLDTPLINGKLSLWDSSPLQGFDDMVDLSVGLAGAHYELDNKGKTNFYQPSIQTQTSPPSSYIPSAKLGYIPEGSVTQFFAEVIYDVRGEVVINFCITNEEGDYDEDCSSTETFTSSTLGDHNAKLPVSIKSMKKTFYSMDETTVMLNVDFVLINVGGGEVIDPLDVGGYHDDILRFNLLALSGAGAFFCDSPDDIKQNPLLQQNQASSLPLRLDISQGEATVHCSAPVSVTDTNQFTQIKTSLDYGYRYVVDTGEIPIEG